MTPVMQTKRKSAIAVAAQADSAQNPLTSFGTALLGFMVSTTLATSLMVLLSQG